MRWMELAIALLMSTVALSSPATGQEDTTFDALLLRADSLDTARRPDSAIILARDALVIAEREFGEGDTRTALVHNRLGRYYYLMGVLGEAEDHWTTSLKFRESLLGPGHIETAKTRINLGTLRQAQGRFEDAARHIEEALPVMEREYGTNHANVGRTILNLGNAHFSLGRLLEAENELVRALEIFLTEIGASSWESAATLNGLASVYLLRGNYIGAEEKYRKAAGVYRTILGDTNVYLARVLHNIGKVCRDQGKLDEALSFYQSSLAIYEALPEAQRGEVGHTLNNIGRLYLARGEIREAEKYIGRAYNVCRGFFDGDHPLMGLILENQAEIMMLRMDYAAADSLLDAAESIARSKLDSDHPEVAGTLEVHGKLYRLMGEYRAAVDLSEEACRSRLLSLQETGAGLSERDALVFAGFLRGSLDLYLSACDDAGRIGNGGDLSTINLILSSKGQVSEAMASRQRRLVHDASESVSALLDSLNVVKFQISREFVKAVESTGDQGVATVDSLSQLARRLESKLSRQSAQYRAFIDRQQVAVEEIVAAMPPRSAVVEFVRYDYIEAHSDSETGRYLAVVIGPDISPAILELGPADTLEALIGAYHSHMMKVARLGGIIPSHLMDEYRELGEELHRELWKPISEFVKTSELVFIAPDGAVNLVSFAGLPIVKEEYLVERHAFHYLSSARDILPLDGDVTGGLGLLALGDPAFYSPGDIPHRTPPRQVNASSRTAVRAGCLDLENKVLSPLPDTRQEIATIVDHWRERSAEPVTTLFGTDATERSFKERASGSRVIHLATHGYFLEGSCLGHQQPPHVQRLVGFAGENPLLLSGLFLAGVKAGDSLHGSGLEDGVLTAYEVSALDLTGTDLVVLSACESGLGKVEAGEGVFGLRRAFQMAGARTVISALSPVADESAAAILGQLHKMDDSSMPAVIRSLQLHRLNDLRENGKITHPADWAPYVALGDWQ